MPSTYIDSGTVASETSGASVAPMIEPVAKMTAELAPVSACAAASRTTLPRARASPAVSSLAVTSIIGRDYEERRCDNQPLQAGARHARMAVSRIRLVSGCAAPLEHQDEIVGRHFERAA